MSEHLGIEENGWVRYLRTGYGGADAVRVRFAPSASGRLIAVEVRVVDGEGVRADQLRAVPLARLERWVNTPEVAGALSTAGAEIPRPRVSPRIVVPPRSGRSSYPDSFYRRVAEVVSAGWSTKAVAERSEVPESTVNRWIKGARQRGFLAASRPGEKKR